MSNIITNLSFHNTDYKELVENDISNKHFGILEINIPKKSVSPHYWDIVFSIDNSGSMSDLCSDNRSKIDHIKNTISNILLLFSNEKEARFNVYLQIFNFSVTEIFDFTEITEENVHDLIKKIDKIYPGGCTNLKIPLQVSKNKLKERIAQYSNSHQYIHIELTDGDDTCDNTINQLNDECCNDYKNIFIGFGIEHNCIVLDSLASKNKNEYRFIDKIESAGLVYGEIVHSLLYMKFPDVEIHIKNGKLYNWRTNEWVDKLNIGSLSSGTDKFFHVKSDVPSIVDGFLYDVDNKENIDEFSTLPELIDENDVIEIIDHIKYLYRQKTQELLYESKIFYSEEKEKKDIFQKKLKTFFENIKEYINSNNLSHDIFWKVLLDDIYIAYKTFNTSKFYLYTNSRQTSQGNQLTYNVNNIHENKKHNNKKFNFLFNNNNDDIDSCSNDEDDEDKACDGMEGHEMMDNTQTSYSTPEILNLMKTINKKQ